MRLSPLYLLPPSLIAALQIPSFQNIQSLVSGWSISVEDYIPPTYFTNLTQEPHDLLKRQFSNTCPTNFHACNGLGAPGLCCASAAVCSADANGNVACCPVGAECSGTINGVITAGTVNSEGSLISQSVTGVPDGTSSFRYPSTTNGNGGLVPASVPSTVSHQRSGSPSQTGGGFIIDGSSTVASPGAGVRGADVPLIAKIIVRALEYLPI